MLTPGATLDTMTDSIGRRVARLRTVAGISQTKLAAAAGITQPYLSAIESGSRALQKRSLLLALADALGVPPTQLTGQPIPPRIREDLFSYSSITRIRAALDEPDEPVRPRSRTELRRQTGRVMVARMACDHETLCVALPPLLAELRAVYAAGQAWSGPLLVRALVTASIALKSAGWQDLATRLADRAAAVAGELAEPVEMAAAAYASAQCALAAGSRRRSLTIARTAAATFTGRSNDATAWRAMLNLHAGFSAATLGETTDADALLDTADQLAGRVTGDPWSMECSPANVAVWRIGAALEAGTAEQVPDLAARVDRTALRTAERASRLDVDTGRGWYAIGEPDRAIASLSRAYRTAPADVRLRPSVLEIVRQMIHDTDTPDRRLSRLADQLGVSVL
jgi:transcriptional regulator with XRE-family HTH domain